MFDSDKITFYFTGSEYILKGCVPDSTYPEITCSNSQWPAYSYDVSLYADYLYKGPLPRIDEIMQKVNTLEIMMKMNPPQHRYKTLPVWRGTCTKTEDGTLKLDLSTTNKHCLTSTKKAGEKEWTLQWRFYGMGSVFDSMTRGTAVFDHKPIDMTLDSEMTLKTLTTFVLSK